MELEGHYRVHKNPPLDLILRQKSSVHTITTYSFNLHFNILPPTPIPPILCHVKWVRHHNMASAQTGGGGGYLQLFWLNSREQPTLCEGVTLKSSVLRNATQVARIILEDTDNGEGQKTWTWNVTNLCSSRSLKLCTASSQRCLWKKHVSRGVRHFRVHRIWNIPHSVTTNRIC
jgi:hypothetical protein